MEKRNLVERGRTKCKGSTRFCECPDCKEQNKSKQASETSVSIHDTEALARLHK